MIFEQKSPKAAIVPYGVKRSGIKMSNKRLGLKSSWLKNLGFKSPELKCPATNLQPGFHLELELLSILPYSLLNLLIQRILMIYLKLLMKRV